jgi:hypothetical protein
MPCAWLLISTSTKGSALLNKCSIASPLQKCRRRWRKVIIRKSTHLSYSTKRASSSINPSSVPAMQWLGRVYRSHQYYYCRHDFVWFSHHTTPRTFGLCKTCLWISCQDEGRTEEPDYSALPEQDFVDWAYSVYGNVREIELNDAAEALGKYVTLTHYADANLFHDIITGRSVTGILHLVNKTPIAWYSKKQATVETAAYGSEYVAARTCVGQVMYLRLTLRYLGVSIHSRSYMCFGDNKTVVESSI